MDPALRRAALEAKGFMPEEEGLALYRWGREAGAERPLLEIGSYCGKSSIYLGAAARANGTVLYSIDHHRGSEEQQPGQPYHDADLVDPATGAMDTLPSFRRTIATAGLEDTVIAVVGSSSTVARRWATPLALVFIDGGHTQEAVTGDYEGWVPHLTVGGLLAIHDVFEDPSEGGRPPHAIYRRALRSGAFSEAASCGSLRVLQRVGEGL